MNIRPSSRSPAVDSPLLNAAEIAELAFQARHWIAACRSREVSARHAGDWPSAHLGGGMDFEEARPYLPGDDLRDMDWRSTARLRRPFVKTYREERQPVWHIVVDRGPAMRFGTRRRLKVTQAARIALLACHAAEEMGVAVGLSLWDEQDLLLSCRHGRARLPELAHAVVSACPPLPASSGGRSWAARLQALRMNLPREAQVWILSDGHWLDDSAEASLAALSAAVRLHFVRITDPAETQLPAIGHALFEDLSNGFLRHIDTDSNEWRRMVHAQWEERRMRQDALLQRCRIRPLDIATPVDDLVNEIMRHE